MGGVGSGKKPGRQAKKTTEEVPFIDVRMLNRNGYLDSVNDGTFTWSIGEIKRCSVHYQMLKNKIILLYNKRAEDGNWQPCRQEILFSQTSCNYGGSRKWFVCSNCGKRVALLYFLIRGFYCRHCNNLSYASQQETKKDRMRRKARNIRSHLGASDNLLEPLWEKPKNMHYSTFERLRREAELAHNLSWIESDDRFAKN